MLTEVVNQFPSDNETMIVTSECPVAKNSMCNVI